MKGFALLCASAVGTVLSFSSFISTADAATSVNLSFVRAASSGNTQVGVAVDSVTGLYYARSFDSSGVTVYANKAAYESNTAPTTVTLASPSYNEYFAVNNGKYFGRTDTSSSSIGRWNAVTGAFELGIIGLPNTGGTAGVDDFTWGGYSGPSVFSDSTGLYALGHSTTVANTWYLHQLDSDLNVLGTKSFTASTLGWAFMMNGELYYGIFHNNKNFAGVLDYASGAVSTADYVFNYTAPSGAYIDNVAYIDSSDTLYLHHANDSGLLYSLENASSVFAIPEPASLGLLAFGSLALLRRRHG